ncbi:50S ribosomal protein L6 [candidate division WWE3 bacterium]|uniref:Large ribosomal subunit protein uL6 n=1 Tax=candidate division WWE3 bacterium TaxID=2053526 RepID=A0A7X9E6P0_UNCKA|nr:50S ribosomal protein L6 [candidate division WWE3 bacterium]
MSRIGRKPIEITQGVTVEVNGGEVVVRGPKGVLTCGFEKEIGVKVKEGVVRVEVLHESKRSNALWGLTRALVANMIKGVTEGFEKKLELVGVGYRAKSVSPSEVVLTVGFSHPVEFKAPEGIVINVVDNTHLTVSGADKQLVGLVAAKIRKIKKPEPYKGKGIRYEGERVRRKAGKAGKVGSGGAA